MDQYFLFLSGRQNGPYCLDKLRLLWRTHQVDQDTLYWQEGLEEWLPLGTIADEMEPAPAALPLPPRAAPSARVKVGSTLLIAEGFGGSIELHEHKVIIRRKGALSFMNLGVQGAKEILLSQISSIQFKPAGFLSGYIRLSFLGGTESKVGILGTTADENAVLFNSEQQPAMEAIKLAIEKRLVILHTSVAPAAAQNAFSPADELGKLALLRGQRNRYRRRVPG